MLSIKLIFRKCKNGKIPSGFQTHDLQIRYLKLYRCEINFVIGISVNPPHLVRDFNEKALKCKIGHIQPLSQMRG